MRARFRAHDTFFIRKGWLSKGLRHLRVDPSVFMGKSGNPMDILGIGANMVKALRFWMQAVGLTEEKLVKGHREQHFTPLGRLVIEHDPYIEEIGTLWLLHHALATNNEEATAWYYFFNEFRLVEFTREDFVAQLKNHLRLNDIEVSERSLEDDFTCIMSTYVPRVRSSSERVHPENNIDCPLGELGLIDIVDKRNRVYRKAVPNKDSLHPLILFAMIAAYAEGKTEIRISSLQSDPCGPGKLLNLDSITLNRLLYGIELLGYIKVIRTAGLDVVRIERNLSMLDAAAAYYQLINS